MVGKTIASFNNITKEIKAISIGIICGKKRYDLEWRYKETASFVYYKFRSLLCLFYCCLTHGVTGVFGNPIISDQLCPFINNNTATQL